MAKAPTDDELYWALAALSAHAPSAEMRRNAVLLLSQFRTERARSSVDARMGVFGAPDVNEPIPKHRAPTRIEEREESKALVVAAQRHIEKKKKEEFNDPVFKCLQDHRTCLEAKHHGATCFFFLTVCMARAFVPKSISGISINKGGGDE